MFGQGFFRNVGGDEVVDDLMTHIPKVFGNIVGIHQLFTLFVNDLALVIHDIVELEKVFTDFEVAFLNLLLGFFKRFIDPGVHDGFAFFEAEFFQHVIDALGAEDAHQIVFQRQEKLRCAGVALASGTAAQLVIDASAFVTLGADYVKAASLDDNFLFRFDIGLDLFNFLGTLFRGQAVFNFLLDAHIKIAAELNIGAAAGHVGGNGHTARRAGLGNDNGFLIMMAGVENFMRDFPLFKLRGKLFGLLDADSANQDRLLALTTIFKQVDDRITFFANRSIDFIVFVGADAGNIGVHIDDLEFVDFFKFAGFGHGGAGHAREFGI